MTAYRRAPRSLAPAFEALADELAPRTRLAEIQRVWTQAVGSDMARQTRATSERGGVVTVSCADSMWAQELDLMAPLVISQLNSSLGSDPVRRLRCVAVGHGR